MGLPAKFVKVHLKRSFRDLPAIPSPAFRFWGRKKIPFPKPAGQGEGIGIPAGSFSGQLIPAPKGANREPMGTSIGNAKPYTDAIFDAVQALVAHTHIDHPIVKKDEDNPRVAVLALTSDRGMAGPYTSSIIRETESLLARLDAAGKQPELYVYGRRGVTYYKYRNRDVAGTWEGDTDQPGVEVAESISKALMDAYMKPASEGGVSELYIVFTEFVNMVVQKVRVLRMLPVELVLPEQQDSGPVPESDADAATPLYAFEPSVDEVLDAILPKYIQSRIHECLLTAAASETASRQNAMHTATDTPAA
mgnify:CR=1 FL=1